MSVLFAATYPERTAALVLRSAFVQTLSAPDYPWGRTEEQYERDRTLAPDLRAAEAGPRGCRSARPVQRRRA